MLDNIENGGGNVLFSQLMSPYGLHLLGASAAGVETSLSTVPVHCFHNLEGIKMRGPESMAYEVFAAVGPSPVNLTEELQTVLNKSVSVFACDKFSQLDVKNEVAIADEEADPEIAVSNCSRVELAKDAGRPRSDWANSSDPVVVKDTFSAYAVFARARARGAHRIIVAGETSSSAITKVQSVSQLEIGIETAWGVTKTFCKTEGNHIAVAIKQVNFEGQTIFADAQEKARYVMRAVVEPREQNCMLDNSVFDDGLKGGSKGNISVITDDGGLLVSPTVKKIGQLDFDEPNQVHGHCLHINEDNSTKRILLRLILYHRCSADGALEHLHFCDPVALSLMLDADEENSPPLLTRYEISKRWQAKSLPFFLDYDPGAGKAVSGSASIGTAVMLADHVQVLMGKDIDAPPNVIEGLEDTVRLAMLTLGLTQCALSDAQVNALSTRFDEEWDG